MKFVSRDIDYAMQALVFMAKLDGTGKKVWTIDEIVHETSLPERFLRRIFYRLAKYNILFSYRGRDGGFSFKRGTDDICFTEIINVFQGDVDLTNCMLKAITCPSEKKCVLRRRLKAVSGLLKKELNKITIASLT